MCHSLLLAPFFGLVLFFLLPWQTALLLYGAIIAVSLFIYWKVMLSQMRRPMIGTRAMVGQYAIVLNAGTGTTSVRFHDEIWRAYSKETLEVGQKVVIRAVEGLTLVVAPLSQHADGMA